MTTSKFASVSVCNGRRPETCLHATSTSSQDTNSFSRFTRKLHLLSKKSRLSLSRRGKQDSWRCGRCWCGSPGNVYYSLSSEYAVYERMAAEEVDCGFLWPRLRDSLLYLSKDEQRAVFIGLNIADNAHQGQFRKSGEPFITHPVEVARILGCLRADVDTIIAGLLHDTIEDTDRVTFKEIGERFGPSVQTIVEGETKLAKMSPESECNESVEDLDFRRFFDSITGDVRILLVKLADRLHNMRTMDSMKPNKQKVKARETLEIYAPLAGLLGLEAFQEELEELSLKYIYPNEYKELKSHLNQPQTTQDEILMKVKERLIRELRKDKILKPEIEDFSIKARRKSFFTLFKLFEKADWKLGGIQRIAQLHISLKTSKSIPEASKLCYYVLGIVHSIWKPVPDRFEDGITSLKPSSWKGLRTTVWPSCGGQIVVPLDILIQTNLMESSNQLQYWRLIQECTPSKTNLLEEEELTDPMTNGVVQRKTISNRKSLSEDSIDEASRLGSSNSFEFGKLWLKQLNNWQTEVGSGLSLRDYLDCVRDDFLRLTVSVFTPRSECVRLPKGATVLDFAYQIHTLIGNRATKAIVDGYTVDLNYRLRSAQVVEVILGPIKQPTIDQLRFLQTRLSVLQTTSAKKKLKYFIKQNIKSLRADNPSIDISVLEEKKPEMQSCFWLRVECEDRDGMLADVSRVITEHGLSISTCWCREDPQVFVMKYQIHDPGGATPVVSTLWTKVVEIQGVLNVSMGCTLPASSSPQEWWRSIDEEQT